MRTDQMVRTLIFVVLLLPPAASANKVLLLGDSNMFGPFGRLLGNELRAAGHTVVRKARCGSGLAYPGFFDWMDEAPRLADKHQADTIIMIFGGNDAQSLKPRRGDSWTGRVPWKDEDLWRETYRDRVARFANRVTRGGRRLIVLAPTNRRPERASRAMLRIREEQRTALSSVPGTRWIDTYVFSSDETGRYRAVGGDRRRQKLRRRDGIHLTEAGARDLVTRLSPSVARALHTFRPLTTSLGTVTLQP